MTEMPITQSAGAPRKSATKLARLGTLGRTGSGPSQSSGGAFLGGQDAAAVAQRLCHSCLSACATAATGQDLPAAFACGSCPFWDSPFLTKEVRQLGVRRAARAGRGKRFSARELLAKLRNPVGPSPSRSWSSLGRTLIRLTVLVVRQPEMPHFGRQGF